ncbi:DUF4446 family protein [Patescibacteria group bacterium]|nr:DUF4446 family protein [Patescibacteria group bacterium]
MQTVYYILAGLGLWLLIVSFLLVWIFKYFRHLSKDVKKGNLIKVLDKVLAAQGKNAGEIKAINKKIQEIEDQSQLHIQKMGLVRFNPFEELGGSHSFSLALLDGKNNGIIVTGLHTREKTRVYVKHIKGGKSKVKFSDEEKKALKLAQKS